MLDDTSKYKLYLGDSSLVLKDLPDNSVHSLVTDPPAGIDFMPSSIDWDQSKGGRDSWINWLSNILREAYRILLPGAYGFIWAIPRTSHWTAMACENAGFDIKNIMHHLFGSGLPKGLNIYKALLALRGRNPNMQLSDAEIETWKGYNSELKPACEHWILVRKPNAKGLSIVENVLEYGAGGLNIDENRIATNDYEIRPPQSNCRDTTIGSQKRNEPYEMSALGRYPSNTILTHDPACSTNKVCVVSCPIFQIGLDSGITQSTKRSVTHKTNSVTIVNACKMVDGHSHTDAGDASRFFYCMKPTRSEKEDGLENSPDIILHRVNSGGLENEPRFAPIKVKNNHPTVKGIELMQYLIKLVTPRNGIVLDPFMGSGSTGVAAIKNDFRFIGIE